MYRSAKCNGEWPSLPYAGLCTLRVHAKPDKLGSLIDAIGIEIHLLKVNFIVWGHLKKLIITHLTKKFFTYCLGAHSFIQLLCSEMPAVEPCLQIQFVQVVFWSYFWYLDFIWVVTSFFVSLSKAAPQSCHIICLSPTWFLPLYMTVCPCLLPLIEPLRLWNLHCPILWQCTEPLLSASCHWLLHCWFKLA